MARDPGAPPLGPLGWVRHLWVPLALVGAWCADPSAWRTYAAIVVVLTLQWPFCVQLAEGVEIYLPVVWTTAAVAYVWGPVALPILVLSTTLGFPLLVLLDTLGVLEAKGVARENLRRYRGEPHRPGVYEDGLLRQVEYQIAHAWRALIGLVAHPLPWPLPIALGEAWVTLWHRLVPLPGRNSVASVRARFAAALGSDMLAASELLHVVVVTAIVAAHRVGGMAGFVGAAGATLVLHWLVYGLSAARLASDRDHRRLLEVQEELAQRERMAMIGRTASSVFHQIGRHHGTIGLYAHLLARGPSADPAAWAETVREHGQRIAATVAEANRVMDELLRFGQDRTLNLYRHEWTDVVAEAVEECAPRAAAGGVTIACDLQPCGALSLDKHKILQVVGNLLDNAVEASAPGAAVEVTTRSTRDAVEVVVRDHGAGIPDAVRPRLFTPFMTTKPDGIGLGLALAHELVAAHRGRIECRNAERGGAEFLVSLPRSSA